MIRFRINELLSECNEARPRDDHLHMGHLAVAIGTARSTLAGLTTLTREPVTNTATFEAMCRFFQLNHPDFHPSLLMEFVPPLEETQGVHLDELYPLRANRGDGARRRRE